MTLTVDSKPTTRCCRNCACYLEVKSPQNPLQHQGFCRRDPAESQNVRMEVPRMRQNAQGQQEVVMGRDGKPVMEIREQLVQVHKLTSRMMVCFDGWRPLGTQPGDDWRQHAAVAAIQEWRLRGGLPEQLPELLGRWRSGPSVIPPAANDAEAAPQGGPTGSGG